MSLLEYWKKRSYQSVHFFNILVTIWKIAHFLFFSMQFYDVHIKPLLSMNFQYNPLNKTVHYSDTSIQTIPVNNLDTPFVVLLFFNFLSSSHLNKKNFKSSEPPFPIQCWFGFEKTPEVHWSNQHWNGEWGLNSARSKNAKVRKMASGVSRYIGVDCLKPWNCFFAEMNKNIA